MKELIGRDIREPLCGWQWVYSHYHDLDNWQPTIEFISEHSKQTIHLKQINKIQDIININRR